MSLAAWQPSTGLALAFIYEVSACVSSGDQSRQPSPCDDALMPADDATVPHVGERHTVRPCHAVRCVALRGVLWPSGQMLVLSPHH